jgi:SNF2 family DNA or RNA helicase
MNHGRFIVTTLSRLKKPVEEMRKFRQHQREAFRYAKERDFVSLLMQMRLGKTLVAIRWAEHRTEYLDPVLIISPTTTLHVWQHELKLEGIDSEILSGSSNKKLETLLKVFKSWQYKRRWVLVNPEGIRACPEICKAIDWEAVIVDETGGWLTNPRSKISKTLQRHLGDVPKKAMLTGLPDPNGPEDYVQQMIFTFGEFMGHRSFWTWRTAHMQPGFFCWELKPNTRRKIKREVRKLAFRKTAKQAGVFVPKVYETRVIAPPPMLTKLMRQLKKDYELGAAEAKYTVVVNTWLAMLSGGIVPREYDPKKEIESTFKVEEIIRLLKGELKRQRIVIWARFTRELRLLQRELKRAGIGCGLLHGLTKHSARPKILQRFADGEFPVILIQAKVGQYGLNISHANAMFFYSNEWDWGIRGQCEMRLDDMNKKVPVLIVDFVAEGTIDECVVAALKEKKTSSKDFAQRVFVRARKAGLL